MAGGIQARRAGAPPSRGRAPTLDECRRMGASCVCFQLRKAARAVTQRFDAIFASTRIKATQFTLLSAVSVMGPVSVASLAEWLVTDCSTLSRNLALLERRKLLRSSAGSDRRVRQVRLTAAGRRTLVRAYPSWRLAQATIASEFGGAELDGALAALARMTSRALESGPAVTARRAARRRSRTAR